MLSASATDEPPYFCTIKLTVYSKPQKDRESGRAPGDSIALIPGPVDGCLGKRPTALKCATQSYLVGVFQVTTNGKSTRKARHREPWLNQESTEVGSCCFALEIGISRNDDLRHRRVRKTRE